MPTRECPVCERPVRGAVLCQFCTDEVWRCLAAVPVLLAELEVNATRQSKTVAQSSGGRSAETPLPYGERASDAARQLADTLKLWARTINPQDRPFTALTAAVHLRNNILLVRQHDMAEKIYDQITRARAHAMMVIDRPPELIPAGRCDADLGDGSLCPVVLYVDPDRASVRCRCGAEHDMDRSWMLEAARDQEWTAAEIGRVTPGLTAAMVRDYARRGRITACGERRMGPNRSIPTYLVGDLLDLLAPAKETA